MKKILIADRLELGSAGFRVGPGIEIVDRAGIDRVELKSVIGEFDALIVRSRTKVDREILEAAGRLQVIGRAGTGVDNIDVETATRRGVLVMNVPGGNSNSAAEHTMALIFAMARNVASAQASLVAGKWEPSKFIGVELAQKTLGVVGLGRIGLLVAEKARGVGMRVVGYDPVTSPSVAADNKIEFLTLDEVVARSDFVTIHVPLAASTKNLFNAELIAKMKPGARLVNCARGGLVDEAALADAIKSGHLGGAALDVYAEEPPVGSPLLLLPKVVVTPHLGASTIEAQVATSVAIMEQIGAFFATGQAIGAVNGSMIDPSLRAQLAPYVDLAKRLGRVFASLGVGSGKLTARAYGSLVSKHVRALTASFLVGFLERELGSEINDIAAHAVARDRGMTIEELPREEHRSFQSLIFFSIERDEEKHEIAGTVFGKSNLRMVRFDGINLDAIPEGWMLVVENRDTPGVVGRVGTALGQAGVNIANMSLGRNHESGIAIALINVDQKPPAGVMAALRGLPDMVTVHLVKAD